MGIIIKNGIQYGNQPDCYTKIETDDLLDTKQDELTFDVTPTTNSNNPATSDGIKTALDLKFDKTNIYNALDKTVEGYALDARQGKVLAGKFPVSLADGGLGVDFSDATGNAGFHNSIYRGKDITEYLTDGSLWDRIAGTNGYTQFEDLFIGDYFVKNDIVWRIAAFNYWLNTGDTSCTTPHVVIVPDTNLATAKMNATNITTGGYVGSDFYTGANSNTGKSDAITKVNAAFGAAHILSHRELLTVAVTDGKSSGWAWCDSTVDLMNENMVYGSNARASAPSYETGIDKGQLPLFRLDHSRICNHAYCWLRSVASVASFALVDTYGFANHSNASNSFGVRPAFAIKA